MKIKRTSMLSQRRIITARLKAWTKLLDDRRPPSGWIKAVRGALGMTTEQLAKRMKMGQASVARMETREAEGKITLETLERAARSLNCRLVYALVPEEKYRTLDEIVEERARKLARAILGGVDHTMALESQQPEKEERLEQFNRLVREFKESNDPRLWSDKFE
jgi:predicted DNA-binding mobile mystery protein A